MQRVMIIGQPGAGKSTLARRLGALTYLPVVHIDHIHWKSGWIERDRAEKSKMALDVIKDPQWIFEGGHSATWAERLDRADTLIWLDISLSIRAWRVLRRTLLYYGRTRPELPDGCPEQFSLEFWSWIWRTRHSGRQKMQTLYENSPSDKATYHLTSAREVNVFLSNLSEALAIGNLGIPHR